MDKTFYWIGVICVGSSTLYITGCFVAAFVGWLFKKLGIEKHRAYFWDVLVAVENLDAKDCTPND